MGKINQGILGGFSGKVGGVVGTSWKGINVMKGYQPVVSNPKSTGQVNQRSVFGNVSKLASILLASVIAEFWNRFASRMSGYNSFCSANKTAYDENGIFIPANALFSSGKMETADVASAVADVSAKTVTVALAPVTSQRFSQPTDIVRFIVMDVDLATPMYVGEYETTRASAEAGVTFDVPEGIEIGHDVYVYAACGRLDGTIVANSTYLKATVQA